MTEDIEVLKLGNLFRIKNRQYWKIIWWTNWMDVSDDKDSYERYQISKNDEEKVTEDIEVLKLLKLSSYKKNYIDK